MVIGCYRFNIGRTATRLVSTGHIHARLTTTQRESRFRIDLNRRFSQYSRQNGKNQPRNRSFATQIWWPTAPIASTSTKPRNVSSGQPFRDKCALSCRSRSARGSRSCVPPRSSPRRPATRGPSERCELGKFCADFVDVCSVGWISFAVPGQKSSDPSFEMFSLERDIFYLG